MLHWPSSLKATRDSVLGDPTLHWLGVNRAERMRGAGPHWTKCTHQVGFRLSLLRVAAVHGERDADHELGRGR